MGDVWPGRLTQHDDVATRRMGETEFVENVGIVAADVGYDKIGCQYRLEYRIR
jgi:hypothetical protein